MALCWVAGWAQRWDRQRDWLWAPATGTDSECVSVPLKVAAQKPPRSQSQVRNRQGVRRLDDASGDHRTLTCVGGVVGAKVGTRDGKNVGCIEGELDGGVVGARVGFTVGTSPARIRARS